MLYIKPFSHTDHVAKVHLEFLQQALANESGRSTYHKTFDLPASLPSALCGIYGPIMGDPPIKEEHVHYACRPGRRRPSRLIRLPTRPVRVLTAIVKPYNTIDLALVTCYGGYYAPKEANDTSVTPEERTVVQEFWRDHALCIEV